jgi:hypothetical protein
MKNQKSKGAIDSHRPPPAATTKSKAAWAGAVHRVGIVCWS